MHVVEKVLNTEILLNGTITALSVSDSGRYAALGGSNGTIGIYCFEDKRSVCLMMVDHQVNCIDWAGPTILAGDVEGSLHLFI